MTEKKLNKITKELGNEMLQELEGLSPEDLKSRLVLAEQAIAQAEAELEANTQYQNLKENLKAMSAGMKEVKKRQKAIISFSVYMLEEKGQ